MKKAVVLAALLFATSSLTAKPYEWNGKNNIIQASKITACITVQVLLAALVADDDLPASDRYTILNPQLFPHFTGAIKNIVGYQNIKSTTTDCIIFFGVLAPLAIITGMSVLEMVTSYKNRKNQN